MIAAFAACLTSLVAPDYILVAREKVDEFIKVCSET